MKEDWRTPSVGATMKSTSVSQAFLEEAVDAIGRAAHEIFDEQAHVPFAQPTDLIGLTPDEEHVVRLAERTSYRARPAMSAINFCLTAASSLLGVSHSLLDQSRAFSTRERASQWQQFAEDTKIAGRAAYRAALVLSEPDAINADGTACSERPAAKEDAHWQIAQREKVLGQSRLFRQWNRIKAHGITASEFIEFLRPLADLDGICVSYVYTGEGGDEKIYNHGKESPAENPMSEAIKRKELTLEKALSFALNEEGRMWIESNFLEI